MARESFNDIWANSPASDQFEEPPTTTFSSGWEGGADKDPPEAKWENWWHNRVDEALQDIERDGAMTWLATTPYNQNGLAISASGEMYASQSDGNTGNDPDLDDGTNWLKIVFGRATETIFGFLRKATQTEVDNGASVDAAITPEKMKSGFSINLSNNGHLTLPSFLGGLRFRWGRMSGNTGDSPVNGVYETQVDVTWNSPFTTEPFIVLATVNDVGNVGLQEQVWTVTYGQNAGAFRLACRAANRFISAHYLAIGI